ncbi:hypothetical protein NC652_034154 [Populus alba x Populus x berolinensis]|nr:hypothetical protein NC652_034154 [Populus alba x Populus x berolinensis]
MIDGMGGNDIAIDEINDRNVNVMIIVIRKCNLSNEVWSGFQLLRSTEVARSSSCLFVVYSSAVFNTLRYSKVVCGILCELRLRKSYLRGNIKPITKIRIRPVK